MYMLKITPSTFNSLLDSICFSQNLIHCFNHTHTHTYDIQTEHVTVFPENRLLSDRFLIILNFTVIDYTAPNVKAQAEAFLGVL